jgi:hypothetical protein
MPRRDLLGASREVVTEALALSAGDAELDRDPPVLHAHQVERGLREAAARGRRQATGFKHRSALGSKRTAPAEILSWSDWRVLRQPQRQPLADGEAARRPWQHDGGDRTGDRERRAASCGTRPRLTARTRARGGGPSRGSSHAQDVAGYSGRGHPRVSMREPGLTASIRTRIGGKSLQTAVLSQYQPKGQKPLSRALGVQGSACLQALRAAPLYWVQGLLPASRPPGCPGSRVYRCCRDVSCLGDAVWITRRGRGASRRPLQ